MNHEAITPAFLHPTGQTIQPPGDVTVDSVRTEPDEVLREFFVHGVSVIEVKRTGNKASTNWDYVQRSSFNRRVHTLTEMKLSGPAASAPYMVTKYSPDGSETRGTVNNCAQRLYAVGHVPYVRRELGGLLPPHHATDDPRARRKSWPRSIGMAWLAMAASSGRRSTPDTRDNLLGGGMQRSSALRRRER